MKKIIKIIVAVCLVLSIMPLSAQDNSPGKQKLLGIYIHQHWAYNHPYAARILDNRYRHGYLEGISLLGYSILF